MPYYTLCLLLRANLTDSEREKFLKSLTETLSNSSKPEIISWGKKDLVYPIQKETQAFYYLLNFEADGKTPAVLDKKLKLENSVLRFLIVKRKKKTIKETGPSPEATAGKAKEEKETRPTPEATEGKAKEKKKSTANRRKSSAKKKSKKAVVSRQKAVSKSGRR